MAHAPAPSPGAPPVVVWVAEGSWRACVDAARAHAPADVPVVLVHVAADDAAGAAHGAFAGLLGRGRPERDPGAQVQQLSATSGQSLLQAAARRLGRSCALSERHGRAEREVVAAAAAAALLVLARDGDRSHVGPRSLGPASRFVVDHAPCPVLLVWPDAAPEPAMPPPAPPPPNPGRPPGPGAPPGRSSPRH